jgi:hypothetical protein
MTRACHSCADRIDHALYQPDLAAVDSSEFMVGVEPRSGFGFNTWLKKDR